MGKKLKVFLKNRILIFILGGLIFNAVSVFAATYFLSNDVIYDNSTSGLKSTDVQGAIDELYGVCSLCKFSDNYIFYIARVDNSHDGIYKLSINGGTPTLLMSYNYDLDNVSSLTASNEYIFYIARVDNSHDGIYRLSINGGTPTLLMSYNYDWDNVTFLTASNKYVFYIAKVDNSHEGIYRLSINGGTPTLLMSYNSDFNWADRIKDLTVN